MNNVCRHAQLQLQRPVQRDVAPWLGDKPNARLRGPFTEMVDDSPFLSFLRLPYNFEG